MFKGAIFDLDDTLLDVLDFHYKAWEEALRPFGVDFTLEEYSEYMGNKGTRIAADIIRKYNLDIKPESLFNKKIELVTKWFKTKPLKIKPSAKEAIEFFINQGVKVAVATGGPRDETMVKLERSGLLPFFDTVVCMEDVNMGKPNPDIYIKTANKIGLKPEDCIAFEDTEYGLLSAKRAGMICVVFPNKASEKQDLSEADLKISDFRQAIDWVKKQS